MSRTAHLGLFAAAAVATAVATAEGTWLGWNRWPSLARVFAYQGSGGLMLLGGNGPDAARPTLRVARRTTYLPSWDGDGATDHGQTRIGTCRVMAGQMDAGRVAAPNLQCLY